MSKAQEEEIEALRKELETCKGLYADQEAYIQTLHKKHAEERWERWDEILGMIAFAAETGSRTVFSPTSCKVLLERIDLLTAAREVKIEARMVEVDKTKWTEGSEEKPKEETPPEPL